MQQHDLPSGRAEICNAPPSKHVHYASAFHASSTMVVLTDHLSCETSSRSRPSPAGGCQVQGTHYSQPHRCMVHCSSSSEQDPDSIIVPAPAHMENP